MVADSFFDSAKGKGGQTVVDENRRILRGSMTHDMMEKKRSFIALDQQKKHSKSISQVGPILCTLDDRFYIPEPISSQTTFSVSVMVMPRHAVRASTTPPK